MARFYTIGHSSRSFEEFRTALETHGVDLVVDIRSLPGSDRHPQFDQEPLADTLADHGIEYRYLEDLGGRRSNGRDDSPNAAWENESFRAYADYALTDEFERALQDLVELGEAYTPAIMCAEAVYWRCHRRIVADWLLARGHEVVDIFGQDRANEHELTRFAVAADGEVHYPPEET